MATWAGLWLLVWSLFWAVSLQDDDTFSFINPPPQNSAINNPQYVVGSDIDIQWVGPNDFVSVRFVHVLPNNDYSESISVFKNVTNLNQHYTWQIALNGMNLSSSNVFFFNIYIEGQTEPRAITHFFNVTQSSSTTDSASPPSTSTAPATTPSVTSPATNSITSMSTLAPINNTTPAVANNAPVSNSGLDTGAKAGIGIGVSAGALSLIAGGLFFWRRRNRQSAAERATAEGTESGQSPGDQTANQESPRGEHYKSPGVITEPSEGPTTYAASELPVSEPTPLEMADTSTLQA